MVSLFKKKSSSAAAGKVASVVVSDDGDKSLVFGMTWRSVASRVSGKADATKLARKSGATHLMYKQQQYAFASVPSDAVGVLYPAAQVAARQNGGNALYAVRVFEGEYWIAVIRGAQPSEIDRIVLLENDGDAFQLAMEELRRSEDEGVSLTVFTNLEGHSFGQARLFSVSELFLAASGEEDHLLALPKGQSAFPKPVLIGVIAVASIAIGNKGWNMYKQHERQRLAAMNMVADEDPAEAWDRAIKAWEASRVAQDAHGLTAARLSLGATPVLWGGWYLETAGCTAAASQASLPAAGGAPAGAPSNRPWSCSATYQRLPVGSFNRDMQEKALPGWTIQYKGLEQIVVSWTLTQPTAPFKISDLLSPAHHQVETTSRLQRLLPAISQVNAPTFTSAAIVPPKKADGTVVPMPASVPQVMEAPVSLKAPFRTIDALIGGDIAADWTGISVTFAPGASDSALSLRGSSLTADVRGVIYAKN